MIDILSGQVTYTVIICANVQSMEEIMFEVRVAGAQHNEDAHTASRMGVELLFPAALPGIFDAIWSVTLLRCTVARHWHCIRGHSYCLADVGRHLCFVEVGGLIEDCANVVPFPYGEIWVAVPDSCASFVGEPVSIVIAECVCVGFGP